MFLGALAPLIMCANSVQADDNSMVPYGYEFQDRTSDLVPASSGSNMSQSTEKMDRLKGNVHFYNARIQSIDKHHKKIQTDLKKYLGGSSNSGYSSYGQSQGSGWGNPVSTAGTKMARQKVDRLDNEFK